MKKKLIGLLLVGVMTLASLTGCSAAVTAESLIDDAFKDVEYVEYDMSMSVQMAVSQSGVSMDMGIEADLSVEATEKNAYIKGVMEASVFGMTVEQEMENYQVIDGDTMTTYTYDPDYDEWTYAETEVDKDNDNMLPSMESDMFEDLEMEETDDGYEVTGVLANTDELFGLQDETVNALAEGLSEVDILVTFTFNEDKEIEKFEIVFDVDEDETYEIEDMGEVSISEFALTMEFKSFDGDKDDVEVPDDVIDSATEEGTIDDSFFEDDYDDEETEDTEDTEDTESEEVEDFGNGEISYNILEDDLGFEFDGVTYVFGSFTYEEFVNNTGLIVDEDMLGSEEEQMVEPGDYEIVFLDDEYYNYVTLFLKNNSDEAKNALECDVVGFDFEQSYDMADGETYHTLSIGGLSTGASMDAILDTFGTPYSTSTLDTTTYLYYYLNDSYSSAIVIYCDEELGMTGFEVYKQLY